MTYTVIVVHGRKLGRKIGFPTANLEPTTQFSSLRKGVYAVFVQYNRRKYMGVMNIGKRPTVKKIDNLEMQTFDSITVEVNILDFDKQIYGQTLEIEPLSFIREEKKFNSLEELKKQISRDVQFAKITFSERGAFPC